MKIPKLTQAGNALNRAELKFLIDLFGWDNVPINDVFSYLLEKNYLLGDRAETFLKRMKEKLIMQHIYNGENKKP